jgi:membrane peptidoglycan carboxypeptidase
VRSVPGIYGAEAAAQRWFGKPKLSPKGRAKRRKEKKEKKTGI